MGDDKERVFISHGPDFHEQASAFAESLKEGGMELAGRSFWERKYKDSPIDAARFNNLSSQYLLQFDNPQPMLVQPRLFLSYAREDYEAVRRFAEALKAFGVSAWFDWEDVAEDDNWVEEVLQALVSCSGMVVFWSRYYLKSIAACSESDFFLERMKRRSGLFFSFLFMTPESVSEELRKHSTTIDLYRMTSREAAARLISAKNVFYLNYARLFPNSGDVGE